MDSLDDAAWRGTVGKDLDISKVQMADCGHVISLNWRNDSIDADVARLAMMAMLRSKVRRLKPCLFSPTTIE